MIEVTRLDGSIFYVNPHQIEFVELKPDTVVSMLSGRTFVIKDSYEKLIERIVVYRRQIGYFKNEE